MMMMMMMMMMVKLYIVVATKFMKVLLLMKATISETRMRCFPFNLVLINYKPVYEKQEMTGGCQTVTYGASVCSAACRNDQLSYPHVN